MRLRSHQVDVSSLKRLHYEPYVVEIRANQFRSVQQPKKGLQKIYRKIEGSTSFRVIFVDSFKSDVQ